MIRNFISKLYSLYTPSFFMSGGGSPGGYVIERSLRFMSASSQYLTRTPGAAGNRRTWTWSGWLKRGGSGFRLFGASLSNTPTYIQFSDNVTDGLTIAKFNGSTHDFRLTTSSLFRDYAAWYHVVVAVDTTQASASNRIKLYVNGIEITAFTTAAYPVQNFDTDVANNVAHYIGRTSTVTTDSFDGYQAEVNLVVGSALPPSSFGEINPITGQWVAKRYTGTYGTNGFYLDFKDGTSTTTLGYDKSGNNNHWTLTNFTRSAGVNDCWMLDVPAGNGSASSVQPSGNYCTLNPLTMVSGNGSLSNANLQLNAPNSDNISWGTFRVSSGKWYWECTVTSLGAYVASVGVYSESAIPSVNGTQSRIYVTNGQKVSNGSGSAYGATFTTNDVIGVALDMDTGSITFYKNGISQGVAYTNLSSYIFAPSVQGGSGAATAVNFGQRSFAYAPPAGFKSLCTANLPTPSIKKPSEHFDVKLSTGANIKTDSEALFTNELEWIKDRANANNHQLMDSLRGSSAVLQSNTTAAETTYSAPSGSSVGWVWRASDSAAVTNNVGSISSQVSANPTAGFSIVTYTGVGGASTVGHGLGVAPKVIITKSRTNGGSFPRWFVYHVSLGAGFLMYLDTTDSNTTGGNYYPSTPTSSVFSIGNDPYGPNVNGGTYVSYCFADLAGYSKFDSYVGNGNADGTNITLGFKPALVIIKRKDSGSNWTMFDNKRDGYNVDNDPLYANLNNTEATTDLIDLTSNGFKLRSSDASVNASGGTYIYMAFAETPFNYANSR